MSLLRVKELALVALLPDPNYVRPSGLNHGLDLVFRIPLVRFTYAYELFVKEVASDSNAFDHWMNIVINMITSLEGDISPLLALKDTLTTSLGEVTGWEVNDISKEEVEIDYLVLLAIRTYGNNLGELVGEETNEQSS